MLRKTVRIHGLQEIYLKREAALTNKKESEIIREALKAHFGLEIGEKASVTDYLYKGYFKNGQKFKITEFNNRVKLSHYDSNEAFEEEKAALLKTEWVYKNGLFIADISWLGAWNLNDCTVERVQ